MANADLLKWTTSDVDFYELLGITFETCSESELRRAYRKTALKYHPDKVGKDYDPAKFELFQAANEVLSDPELKQRYDNHRNAKILKRRQNDMLEGRRRQMKEDLEAREQGGVKREREESEKEVQERQHLARMKEEGRKRKAARASMMGDSISGSPRPTPSSAPTSIPATASPAPTSSTTDPEEDRVAELERMIREKEEAREKRRAEKRARRSFAPADSPSVAGSSSIVADTATPIKPRPNLFKGMQADEKSSASPKFSFSPAVATPRRDDFAATMERLKAAERQRMEEQIRQQESETAS